MRIALTVAVSAALLAALGGHAQANQTVYLRLQRRRRASPGA
jgi:hypothetical protein